MYIVPNLRNTYGRCICIISNPFSISAYPFSTKYRLLFQKKILDFLHEIKLEHIKFRLVAKTHKRTPSFTDWSNFSILVNFDTSFRQIFNSSIYNFSVMGRETFSTLRAIRTIHTLNGDTSNIFFTQPYIIF